MRKGTSRMKRLRKRASRSTGSGSSGSSWRTAPQRISSSMSSVTSRAWARIAAAQDLVAIGVLFHEELPHAAPAATRKKSGASVWRWRPRRRHSPWSSSTLRGPCRTGFGELLQRVSVALLVRPPYRDSC